MRWVGSVPFMLRIWEKAVLIDMIWLDALFSLFLSLCIMHHANQL